MKNILNLQNRSYLLPLLLFLFFVACKDDDGGQPACSDLKDIPYDPSPYNLIIPVGLPQNMEIPADNPLTEEGVDLGHQLFFDPILSVDSTISCSSCHDPVKALTDQLAVSVGVDGLTGKRSSMSLINVGFFNNGLFWDGRSPTLEEQALHPVEDPVEMADLWENVEEKIQVHPTYPDAFRKAFGISCSEDITKEMVTKAIAQYERTLLSADSRFDKKFAQGNNNPFLFSDEETDGHSIFFDSANFGLAEGHCSHCHDDVAISMLTNNKYFNNGIEDVASYDDFPDLGLGGVTDKQSDIGKFRAPSLRSIALTSPYMHDGRFQTLEEVVEHYNSGAHTFDNVVVGSIPVQGLGMSEYEKEALVAFLHTLSDTSYFQNQHFLNPFD